MTTPLDTAVDYIYGLQEHLDSGPYSNCNIWNNECACAAEALAAIRKLQNAMAIAKQEIEEANHGAETSTSGDWSQEEWEADYNALVARRPKGYQEVAQSGCPDCGGDDFYCNCAQERRWRNEVDDEEDVPF